jgi:hypothetical protein
MAVNMRVDEVVLVFEIENKQDSYARCLSAINYFENNVLNAGLGVGIFYSHVRNIPKSEFTFSVNKRNKGPHDKMEYPITTGEYARVPVPAHEEEKLLESAVNNWRKEKERLERPLYHIRVKFEDDFHIDNLQFLAMFMQQVYFTCFNTGKNFIPDEFVPENLNKRLSIFLLPHSRASWKFAYKDFEDSGTDADTALYSQASQYLRLIAKMHNGVIFGCSRSGKAEAVKFEKRSRDNTFFPLIYLADTNSNVNYHAIFDRSGMPDASIIEKGFTYQVKENDPRPFNKAGSSNPHEAVADLILDETRTRLLNFFASIDEFGQSGEITHDEILESGRKNISEFIKKITDYTAMCDRFTFALFGYLLLSNKKGDNEAIAKDMEETMRLARELGDGIRQIVQNAIQHSQHHICFISLNQVDGQLYVRVTDLNEQGTIIRNFEEILQKEKKHDIFLRNNTDITINHLISEFTSDDNALTAWYAYRKTDSAAHIGLTMFNNTLKRCQCGEFQIISSTKSIPQQNNVYIRSQKNNYSLPNRVIPGTQIYFSIPIATLVNSSPVNLVQLANNNAFSENHIAFAHFLDYKISQDKWKGLKSDLDNVSNPLYHFQIPNIDSKVEAQNKWKYFWIGLMNSPSGEQNQIHLCDINDTPPLKEFLTNRDHCEVFTKGFLAAASVYSVETVPEGVEYCPLCLYFLNLPDHFIDLFQEVSIPLSLMDFSQNLQVYFSCAEKHNTTDDTYQPKRLLILGNCVGRTIQNAYIMSLEYGERSIDKNYYDYASVMLSPYKDKLEPPVTLLVCPFTVFEQPNDRNELPEYFTRFAGIASRDLACVDKDKRGYKFKNIHMRLGNKVHVRSFYEMSFLFYRTTVVNRVAFYILQKIIGDLCNVEDNIVFYGYASYSQALIFSLKEMLETYFRKDSKYKNKKVYYAIYQYNLQTESYLAQSNRYSNDDLSDIPARDKMQIYSELKKCEGSNINTSVVQIVPIGSTLTTFDKMWAKYLKDRKSTENSKIVKNYNVFLIRDANEKDEGGLSNIERDLWDSINTDERTITVNVKDKLQYLEDAPNISYIITEESPWCRPTECDYCFPDDISKEIPLVETDPTSTVPSLQIYPIDPVRPDTSTGINFATPLDNTNKIIRLTELMDCVYYGHFLRGKNHYQYYFDTQKYIKKDIIKAQLEYWLKEERKKDTETQANAALFLNIIFSPEHNTNVGFSQYVNAFYFNGTAEIVSVNVDKQFRSNFICEHDALKQTIERLYSERLNKGTPIPVKFFFVDDSIITGESYHRSRSLLHSLISSIERSYRSEYHGYLFSKCFILIDRLSLSTRESYIADPGKNYLSFCNINISNMRKQGDSCVGCKLENEARHLLKRSSTRSFYAYWAKKSSDYHHKMFEDLQKNDDLKNVDGYGEVKAYVRMLLTHVTGNYIEEYRIKYKKIDRTAIEILFNFIMNESMKPINHDKKHNDIIIDDEETALVKKAFLALSADKGQTEGDIIVCLFEHMVKILARPFFSYNLEVKQHVLGLIIELCESLLSDNAKPRKGLTENIKKVLESTGNNSLKLLAFLRDCLFEALADMKSTYILRKCTIEKAYQFIAKYIRLETNCSACDIKDNCKCLRSFRKTSTVSDFSCGVNQARYFWRKYALNIHKIIDSGDDETRSLWMEHLFSFGTEYPQKTRREGTVMKGVSLPLYETITKKIDQDEEAKALFEEFCMEIFFQNSRLLYDGIKRANEITRGIDPSDNIYFLQNMMKMREWNLERSEVKLISKKITKEEKFMFRFLTLYIENDKNTKRKYKMLVKSIFRMVEAKYGIPSKSLCVALVTQRDENKTIDINTFEIIAIDAYGNSSDSNKRALERTIAKYEIKKRIKSAITNNKDTRLIDNGYYLEMSGNNLLSDAEDDFSAFRKPYFILRFDNIPTIPRSQSIEKVYIYVSFNVQLFENQRGKAIPILVIRDILSYRTHIIHALEKDFNSNLMQIYARTLEENTILANEKTVSHTISSDDQIPVFLWEADKQPEERFEYEWLLFRNYTNIQIAKLFNRLLLEKKDESTQAPKLYLKDGDEKPDGKFTLPAKFFLEDILNDEDGRVKLCKEIIEFKTNISAGARLVTPKEVKGYFNKEYLKCILFDIFLTSAKYWNENVDFLKRINRLKSCKDKYTEYKGQKTVDPGYIIDMDTNERNICRILLLRDVNKLVIINPVDQIDNHVFGGNKKLNQFIKIQIENPYDSFAGRMSLFTISKYITGNGCEAPVFEYRSFNELDTEWKNLFNERWEKPPKDDSTWFISELPIFY